MVELDNILNTALSNAKKIFSSEKPYRHIVINNIDCSRLPDINTDGKNLPKRFTETVFSKLHEYDKSEIKLNLCPAVYAFELKDEQDRKRVLTEFKKAKANISNRTLPALKSTPPESKYLYVGKVEKEVGGRIVTHFGYYQNQSNHGLQLAYWAKNLQPKLDLNLHVFRFKQNFKPYIGAMEVIMAKELKPIIGKH